MIRLFACDEFVFTEQGNQVSALAIHSFEKYLHIQCRVVAAACNCRWRRAAAAALRCSAIADYNIQPAATREWAGKHDWSYFTKNL